MPSKLFKRAVKRERTVQKLAFDKTPGVRKAIIAKVDNSQWHKRTPTNVVGFYYPEKQNAH